MRPYLLRAGVRPPTPHPDAATANARLVVWIRTVGVLASTVDIISYTYIHVVRGVDQEYGCICRPYPNFWQDSSQLKTSATPHVA